ncbi:MAG: glycosyltransferase [Phycisphaerales bacterium]|nr:glycosyltransferase [Phycisphaerales bacterium]
MSADAAPAVTLVIPGRDCAKTLRPCLEAVSAISAQPGSPLKRILFVDDGSRDNSREIAREFERVELAEGLARGAGSARNLGWRMAETPLVWFVDSDCVAEPDALCHLLPHMEAADVGAVSGSYGIMNPQTLLPRLIHEEIIERHLRMTPDVNFLATFNVLYRRAALEQVDGFDERYLKAQDAELSFRVQEAGWRLRFDMRSRVRHYHEDNWAQYLRIQRQQGFWRVWLHMNHRGHNNGDSYSSLLDHVQPPLAMVCLVLSPLLAFKGWCWAPIAAIVVLILAQIPLTVRLLRRTRRASYASFALMSFVRAFWRGVGMTAGVLSYLAARTRGETLRKG